MNRINVQQSGNWSDPNTWGGAVPTHESEIFCNGYILIIDQDIEVKNISNIQTYPDVYGGGIELKNAETTIKGDIISSTGGILTLSINESKIINIIGNIIGSNNYGEKACIYNQGPSTINVIGSVRGGNAGYSPGILNTSTGNINVSGIVCNGEGGWSYGIINEGLGKIIINNITIQDNYPYIGDSCSNLDERGVII